MILLILLFLIPLFHFTFFAIKKSFENNFKIEFIFPKKFLDILKFFTKSPIPTLLILFLITDSWEKFGNVLTGIVFFGISIFLIWKKSFLYFSSLPKLVIFLTSITIGNFFGFLVWHYSYKDEYSAIFTITSIIFSYLSVFAIGTTFWISRKISSLIIFFLQKSTLSKFKYKKIFLIVGIEKNKNFLNELEKFPKEIFSTTTFKNGKFGKFQASEFLGIIVNSPSKFFFENNVLPKLDYIVVCDSNKDFHESIYSSKRFLKKSGKFFINYDFDTKGIVEFCYLKNEPVEIISTNNKKAHVFIKEISNSKIVISNRLKIEEIETSWKIEDFGMFLITKILQKNLES